MLTIDADAHVIETERTWDYLEGTDRRFRPVGISAEMPSGRTRNFWIIDGRLIGGRDNIGKETSRESRELANIDARLRHMDELGTDVQVLYPTLFLRPVTDRPEVEQALCRAYNRWLADIWSKGKGRLRWAVQLPLLTMDKALDELRWARGNGACVVFMRGLETHLPLHHPYFFPLYKEASQLDISIGIHSGIGNFGVVEAFGAEDTFRTGKLAVVGAFHALVMKGIPERFPQLRIGAIEVSSQWVPYVLHDLNLRVQKFLGKQPKPDLMRASQLYVACQTDDDLPYVLKYAGEDSLMIGSDYGHADNASELLALRRLRDRADVDPQVIDKILCTNPARFYGISSIKG